MAGMLDTIDLELAGADLMVHPSIEEPYGIAVLEGLRASLPVVASRVGGIPEVVGEDASAVLVSPRDSAELARVVIDLVEDGDVRRKYAERARARYLAHFEESHMLDRVERYFKTVVEAERIHGKA
jgi:glycosyltransferase involved in cell wall biosynthesis